MKGTFINSPNVRALALPCATFLALLVALAFTTPGGVGQNTPVFLKVLAHYLGHAINSIWVGIGLMLLIIPSLRARSRGELDDWAWRALDAILLDFLIIDAFCRRFIPWPRPGNPTQAGFPSGHATFAFLMAWLVWQRYPKLGVPWFFMAALISWSRVEVNAHYPYQIVVGALVGCSLGALITSRTSGVFLPRVLLSDATLNLRLNSTKTT